MSDEVRAALVLTRRAAHAQFWLAHDLITRLPAVHNAMDAGLIDEPRARVLSEWTTDLTPEQARALCDTLLARVPRLTTGQLIEQIKKIAIAIDPAWAQRRYEQAIAERKVVGYRNPDGSANLSGYNLPVDRVAAACGHIDALAKTAKHTGDPRPLDHIRADLFLGMTDGTYAGLDDEAILDHLRTTHHSEDRPHDEGCGPHDDGGPDDGDDDGDGGPDCGPGDGGPEDEGPDDERSGDGPNEPDDDGGAAEGECSAADDPATQHGRVGAGMELRVRLSTLLGRDDYPGELAGWGPVHAELARDLSGATAEHNLGNACRHDHRVKHEGGWQLHQPEPGVFRWTSRLGHTYHVRTPPIIESLPDPMPGSPPAPPFVQSDDGDESSIWDDTPPQAHTTPSPRPPPPADPDDETPPF